MTRSVKWLRPLHRWACHRYGWAAHLLYPTIALPPVHIDIRNTTRCNLRCPYCSSRVNLNQPETDRLTADEWARITATIPRWTTISFEGGETFLAPDIFDVLDRMLARKLRVSTITNGTTLDPDGVRFLVDRGLTYFICSLDGMPDYHNATRGHPQAFETLTQTVVLLQQYKQQQRATRPVVCVKTNLTGGNSADIPDLLRFVEHDLQADEIFFNLLFDNPTQHGLCVVDDLDDPRLTAGNTYRYTPGDHNAIEQAVDTICRYRQTSKMSVGFSQEMTPRDTMGYVTDPTCYSVHRCHEPWVSFLLHYNGTVTPCQTCFIDNIRNLDYNVRRVIGHPRYREFLEFLTGQMPFAPGCSGCCRPHARIHQQCHCPPEDPAVG